MDALLAGARRVVVLGAVRSGIAAAEALRRCAPHVHVVLADRRLDAGEPPAGVEGGARPRRSRAALGCRPAHQEPRHPAGRGRYRARRTFGRHPGCGPRWSSRTACSRSAIRSSASPEPTARPRPRCSRPPCSRPAACRVRARGTSHGSLQASQAGSSPGRTIVCELSSFQLEGVEQFRADVAVLLNVTPDHLYWHGSFEPLRGRQAARVRAAAGRRIRPCFASTTPMWRLSRTVTCPVLAWCGVSRDGSSARFEGAFEASHLRGPHNRANAACAIAVVQALGG